jgi:hypothetical protein
MGWAPRSRLNPSSDFLFFFFFFFIFLGDFWWKPFYIQKLNLRELKKKRKNTRPIYIYDKTLISYIHWSDKDKQKEDGISVIPP